MMQKVRYLLLLFLFQSHVLIAQNRGMDSLKYELSKKNIPDSTRLKDLLKLGWDYGFINADSARSLLHQAIRISVSGGKFNKTGEALSSIGSSFLRTDNYDSALYYYNKAELYFKKAGSDEGRLNAAINRMSMGTVALQRGDHQTAIHYYLQAINSLEKSSFIEKWTNLVTAYTNVGLVYNDLKQYDKALYYQQKALKLCDMHQVEAEKTVQVRLLVALDFINLKQFDSALRQLNQAYPLSKKINSGYIFATQYGIQGKYFKEQKMYDSAMVAYRRSLLYARNTHNLFQQANMLQQLGMVYAELKAYPESISNFLPSLAISQKIGDKIRESVSLKYLSELYADTKNEKKAVRYYQAYVKLKDSLNEAANKKNINEIENRYQAQKKADSILLLQKTNQLQALSLHKKKIQNMALLVGSVLIIVLAAMLYKNFKRKNQLLKQAGELKNKRIRELEKEQQLVVMQSVLQGQEEERSRLARDLHDGVGGLLSGIKLSLSTMRGNVYLSEENAQSVNNVIVQLDNSIAELRRVSHNMMPETLIKYGLKEALENYCENLNLSGSLKVQLQTYGMEKRIEQNTEIIVYRIAQELLNNVIKHAGATKVLIQLLRKGNRFNLTIEDDGRGFDIKNLEGNTGAGLANVKARTEYLGGTLDVHSVIGAGTSVNIEGNCI